MKIRIATRKSKLALTQTRWVAAQLQQHNPGLEVEEVQIVTKGDKILDRPLSEIGGKGLFITEIETALLDGKADLAVHSMKDVPAELGRGLAIACVPPREDPRDMLVTPDGAELDDLEAGSKIGTSSLRRQAQLRARRNDIWCESLRGNVDTRLRKLEEGHYRAIVLAAAGLNRLGLGDRPGHILPVTHCIPAVGQGALGIETRADDEDTIKLLSQLDCPQTRVTVEAERSFLARLEGGCQLPIAGHAQLTAEGARVRFDACVGSADGEQLLTHCTDRYLDPKSDSHMKLAYDLGQEVAEQMLDKGAGDMIAQARSDAEKQGWKH